MTNLETWNKQIKQIKSNPRSTYEHHLVEYTSTFQERIFTHHFIKIIFLLALFGIAIMALPIRNYLVSFLSSFVEDSSVLILVFMISFFPCIFFILYSTLKLDQIYKNRDACKSKLKEDAQKKAGKFYSEAFAELGIDKRSVEKARSAGAREVAKIDGEIEDITQAQKLKDLRERRENLMINDRSLDVILNT